MEAIVGHREVPMRQPEHAACVGIGAGQERGAAGRAGGRRRKGAAEEHALLGEALQIGCGHGVAKGLDELAGMPVTGSDQIDGRRLGFVLTHG